MSTPTTTPIPTPRPFDADILRAAAAGQWDRVLERAGVLAPNRYITASGSWHMTNSPLRDDEHPSFAYDPHTGAWKDHGGGPEDRGDGFDLVMRAKNCDFDGACRAIGEALGNGHAGGNGHGKPHPNRPAGRPTIFVPAAPPPACTVAAYAALKEFDAGLLISQFDLSDSRMRNAAAISIPYYDACRTLITTRYRTALHKGDGAGGRDNRFLWAKGSRAAKLVYGLHTLPTPCPSLLIVEGESNVHAAAHHAVDPSLLPPAVGIPGKNVLSAHHAATIAAIPGLTSIIILCDPDADSFAPALGALLRAHNYSGRITAVTPATITGDKDISDLHTRTAADPIDGPALFAADWERIVAAATPVEGKTPQTAPNEAVGHSGTVSAASSASSSPESPDDPHRLARLVLAAHYTAPPSPVPTVQYWRGSLYAWCGSHYREVSADELRARITITAKTEFDRLAAANAAAAKPGRKTPETLHVTSGLLTNVTAAIYGLTLLSGITDAPAWLDAPPNPTWAAPSMLATSTQLIHLPSFAAGRDDYATPATPRLFNLNATTYPFDAAARPEPPHWIGFLGSLWGSDSDTIACLQEWFGYCLTTDTTQQKIMMLVGPKRSGKGTIARILRALVGHDNVAGPTLNGLAAPFGLEDLIGRPLAIIPDARLSGRNDTSLIVERLLSISGEDHLSVPRKFRESFPCTLPTRLMLLSNELPRLGDASAALASRMLIVPFTRSFYGQEDHGLTARLLTELPGILLWSVAGLSRLTERGYFVQPPAGEEAIEELEALASPISVFVRERCVVELAASISVTSLYEAWKGWCETEGRDHPGDKASLGRALRAAFPDISTRQSRYGGTHRAFSGIRLKFEREITQERSLYEKNEQENSKPNF